MANKRYSKQQPIKEIDWNKLNSQIQRNSDKRKAENAAKESQWDKARQAREAEKQTESYKRQQAANERHKKNIQLEVRQGTDKFNAAAMTKAKGREASVKAREKRESRRIPSLEKDVVKRYTPIGSNHNYSNFGYAYKTKELTDEGKIQKWLDPNYKMSDREKLEAKDLIKAEQKRRTAEIRKGNQDLMIPGTEEYNRNQTYNNLEAKVKNAGTRGFLLPFLKATNALVKGTEKLTGTENSQAAKALNKQLDTAFTQDELSAGQNPIRHGVGNFAGMGAMYSATNPAFDAAAEGLGLTGTAGKVIANQVGQNLQDIALDTLPEYQRLKDKGLSDSEIRKEIGKNIAFNVAGNAAMQGLSDFVIPTIAKKLGLKEDIPQLAQKFNGKSTVIGSAPDVKIPDIQAQKLDAVRQGDAVKLHDLNMQEDAAEKALKQAKSTYNPASETARNIKSTALEAALRNKDNAPTGAIDKLVAKADELDNAINTGADEAEIRRLNAETKKAYNYLNTKLKKIGDNSLEERKWEYFDKNSEFNVDNRIRKNATKTEAPKPAESPTEDLDFTTPADNTVNTVKYKPGTQDEALETTEWIRDTANDVVTRHEDALTETAKKNVKRLNDGLDALDDAIRQGASPDEIAPLFKEVERAYGALDKNLQRAGVNELRKSKATSGAGGKMFFGDNPYNINNIMRKGRVTEIPTTPEGYIDVSKINQDELVFNDDPIYDAGGHVMLDDEGIPKQRQGVNVNLRQNMDANYGNDVLTAEQKIHKTRSNTMPRSGMYTENELNNEFTVEDAKYWTEQERIPYEEALDNNTNRFDTTLKRYTQNLEQDRDARSLANATDINGMHLMAAKLSREAREATDPAEARRLYAQSRKIVSNLYKANAEAGRAVQSNVKFTRTPEGMVQNAQGFAEDMVEKGLKKNPKMANEIKDVSKEIENFLDEMDIDAMSREEIERMIEQAIVRRDRLRQRVSKGDISRIADSIMNDKQYADIKKQLEFLATGFEDVDAETLDRVQEIFEQAQDLPFNSKERVDLEGEAYKLLATKIVPKGGSFRDKFDAWRYLAMLGNPTTHIKNITGNELFGQGMVSVKNTLAAMLETAADRVSKAKGGTGIDRTKAILTKADKPLLDAASNDALQNAYRELSGNKYYSTGEAIDNTIPAFNSKTKVGRFLNRASDFNTGLLNREDEWATLAKYRTSLAGFLKANGADASIFNATDDASMDLLESARQYAINQAKEAAFHQDSELATKLANASRDARNSTFLPSKAKGVLGDVVIPFKKTPINIVKSAWEYSPAQIIKVIQDVGYLNKGVDKAGKSFKAADFIDDISKGVTGTAALGIGALLAHEGILKIGADKSDEESSFDTQTGRQNVAIKAGNKYVKLSELIPAAAPIILGGTIYETIKNSNGEENALNTIISGMSAIANGATDMTMLSGIADTLNSVRSAKDKDEVLLRLGLDVGGNLASQVLPTLGRKINVTLDDTKRSTYSDKTGATKVLDQTAKYLQTKIPGLQQAGEAMRGSQIPFLQSIGNRLALQPNIDVKGQVQESPGIGGMNNFLGRALENFVSPVKITNDESTVFDDERRRIANATGETKVLPYIASKEANIKDVGQLTPEQWTQYRQQRGQLREQLATAIMSQDQFKELPDVDKAEYLTDIDSFTKEYTQSKYGKEISKANQKLADVYEQGGVDALITRLQQEKELKKADLNVTDKMLDYLDNGGSVDNYLTFEKNITSINDKGNETVKKADFMKELSRLPKDQQELFFNTRKVSLTKAEQEAYDKGGASAVVDTWKQEQTKKTTKKSTKTATNDKVSRVKELNGGGDVQQQLANAGAIDSPTTVEYYNRAKQTIPSLTPKSYANYLHQIGGNDYKISQKEMISYGNSNNLSEDDMNRYWNAFGNWKRNPVLVNGTWKAK